MPISPRKVFLFALPRSGSTFLCDLLTVPGQSVMLHEPMMLRNFGDGRARRIQKTLSKLGVLVPGDPSDFVRGRPAKFWFDESVIPALNGFQFWGVKEVYLSDAQRLVDQYRPDTILLLWRDPRDVAISMLEMMNLALMSFADRKTLKDEAWAFECLCESAEVLAGLARHPSQLRIRYEDLIQSPVHRQSILDAVGASAFGDRDWSFEADETGIRTPEKRRHQDRFSNRSIDRWKNEPDGWRRAFADVCHAAMERDACEVGYDASRLDEQQVCAPKSGTRISRLNDPFYLPDGGFDFVYARRRARLRAKDYLQRRSELGSPVKVLDVGASTAAFAFMLPSDEVTVVDDGPAGAKLMSKPWRQGIFPALDRFGVVTFLFSLEYVEHPAALIAGLLNKGKRVIVAYHCAEDLPESLRNALGFRSHLSRADWVRLAIRTDTKLEHDWAFDGYQSLICLG